MESPFYIPNRLPSTAFRGNGAGVDFAGDMEYESLGFVGIAASLVAIAPIVFKGISSAVSERRRKRSTIVNKDKKMDNAVLGADGNWYQPLGDVDRDGIPNVLERPVHELLSMLNSPFGRPGRPGRPGRHGGGGGHLPPNVVHALQTLRGKPGEKQKAIALIKRLGYDIGGEMDFGSDFGEDFGADSEALGAIAEGEAISADSEFGATSLDSGHLARIDAAIARLTALAVRNSAAIRAESMATVARLHRARAKAAAATRGVGEGGAMPNAAGEPTAAKISKFPMLAPNAVTPRNVFTIPGGGTATPVTLTNVQQPNLDLQVIGFVATSYTTNGGNSEGMVEDFQLTGGTGLFIHDCATQASDYDTELDKLVNLRWKPEFRSPSNLTVSVFATGNQGEIVTVNCKAVCKVLWDSSYGVRQPRTRS